jgi:hypothetical protein
MVMLGGEYSLRMTGAGAKELAAALLAVAKDQHKTKGKTRLQSMLKSGKELKVFNIDMRDLATFATEAKRYGVLYTVIKGAGAKDGDKIDVMVKAEDASKINRIVEKLDYGKVDVADVVSEIEQSREAAQSQEADRGVKGKDKDDLLVDELLEKPVDKQAASSENPTAAKMASPAPSEPISEKSGRSEADITDKGEDGEKDGQPGNAEKAQHRKSDEGKAERSRPSVKAEIEDIKAERKAKPKEPAKPKQLEHQQPAKKRIKQPSQKER